MIHRLALLMGGAGAAGVLALALALGGFGAPLPNTPDAFVPVANAALGGGQIAQVAPTDQPDTTSLGGGNPDAAVRKVIDTVYVVPAPTERVSHAGKPRGDNSPSGNDNAGNNNGDDNAGNNNDNAGNNNAGDDQAGQDDDSSNGDYSDDGGAGGGGQEPGDD